MLCLQYISFQTKIDHETHVRSLMFKMDALQRKHFDEVVSSFLGSCTKYLLNNRPFDSQIIKYARFFQPSLQQSSAAPNATNRLTLCIAEVLGIDEMRRYFKLGSTATKFDLCDVVKKEFREYQTCKIEDKKDEESHENKRSLNKNSLENIDIIYAFLFLLIIVHGTYVLVWNNLLSKQSTIIKLPNEDEKRTIR